MDKDTRPEPAKRLQIARRMAGLKTAQEAADRFGDTYFQHENGIRGLGRAADRYARAFKVSRGWLLTGDGPGPGEHAEAIERLRTIYATLSPEGRQELLQIAETIALAAQARRPSQEDGTNPDT